jgi:hypothetical protein
MPVGVADGDGQLHQRPVKTGEETGVAVIPELAERQGQMALAEAAETTVSEARESS